MHRAEAPCGPCWSKPGQARNRCRAARDDHFLALFRPLNEARELRLGRVNGMSLLHAIHLSQRQLAKQPRTISLASMVVGRRRAAEQYAAISRAANVVQTTELQRLEGVGGPTLWQLEPDRLWLRGIKALSTAFEGRP